MESNISYSIDRARKAQQEHEQKHDVQLEISFTVKTEDDVVLNEGDRAYDYYNMKPGKIGKLNSTVSDPDPWFDFEHDDGTTCLLNGQRICTTEFAVRRGFKNAT